MLPGFPMGVLAGTSGFAVQMTAGDASGGGVFYGYANPAGPTATAVPAYATGSVSGAWLLGFQTDVIFYFVPDGYLACSFVGDATGVLGSACELRIDGAAYGTATPSSDGTQTSMTFPGANPFTAGNTYTLELIPS